MTNEFDIIEHPSIILWLREFAKNEPLGFSYLLKGNLDFFNSNWGVPEGQNQKFTYWKRDYLGITIFVYSSDVATFYKVQYLGSRETFINDKRMGSYLIGFLTRFSKEIIVT